MVLSKGWLLLCCARKHAAQQHATPTTTDSTYVQLHPGQSFVQDAGLIGQGGSFWAVRHFFGETPRKHAAEPCEYPCRPRAPQRVGVRVMGSGLGLDWSGSTYKVKINDTWSFMQDAAARSACLNRTLRRQIGRGGLCHFDVAESLPVLLRRLDDVHKNRV